MNTPLHAIEYLNDILNNAFTTDPEYTGDTVGFHIALTILAAKAGYAECRGAADYHWVKDQAQAAKVLAAAKDDGPDSESADVWLNWVCPNCRKAK